MSGIQIENLVKKYGDNIAVNGLNLNLEKGKVYGFLGPNGAGKSTTMNIITGYIGATSGTVKIDGYDIFKEPEKAKKCVGYLPEIPPLYQDMTVKEYLVFVAELKKIPAKEKMKNIKEVLEMTKTTQVENRLIKNLSKGYKQRVGIAQALIGMPEIIILDEPTVGLDPKQIIEIRQLIKELGKNHTVILSSHILSEISEVCEYIFIISRGQFFIERIVKRKVDIKGMLLRVLAVVLTVLSLCTILFLGMLGLTLTILFAYLTYLVWAYTSVEYEYSFLNTELTIEKIMGQRKRKHVDEFDIKQAEIIAPAVSDEIKSRAGNIVTLDYSTGYGSSDLYSMITNTDKGAVQVLFNADEKLIEAMRHMRPSIVKR